MKLIKQYIKKYSKTIVILNIILLILSIGIGNSSVLNTIVILLLFLLLAGMPEEAFEEDEDQLTDENK